ncbi:hypothetical protein IFM89_002937 [Coptis chinensis]|uniref:DUF3444 domain-containing protein n=1 Tax=Coptis chinensis TaxID=261450 RepID=A0A835ILZ5_9MAGN|nr:hypothetical protein IFM89_002937 [Coptis chinensis]
MHLLWKLLSFFSVFLQVIEDLVASNDSGNGFGSGNAVTEREVGLERVERKKRDIVHELNRVSCGKKPDSNHYDFGSNRKAELFAVGQIWAAYDEERMPRCYARIDKVGHLPFRLGVTWLKPAPGTDNEKRWCEAGLPVVCGAFDPKRSNTVVCQPTVFSHLEADITVAPLAKVAGFRSVFKRSVEVDGGSTFTIPAIYLLRFSHNVPAFRFKDGEIAGVSNGMLELDPLAVPNDLVESVAKPSGKTNSSYSSSLSDHPGPVSSSIILDPENTSMEGKWCIKDFTSGQVWAVYDGSDSMPRHYVLVNSVISVVGVFGA